MYLGERALAVVCPRECISCRVSRSGVISFVYLVERALAVVYLGERALAVLCLRDRALAVVYLRERALTVMH